MYRIDRSANRIQPLRECSFSELGIRERAHLQEWIAREPEALGEELLIIQKEFAGFSDTNERLDLLALDKQGSLVIIENKLDDTGRDVTWQALKYASYCAGLSKADIRRIFQDFLDRAGEGARAEDRLCEFFEVGDFDEIILNKGVSQRIILVAARFRKEVTSTVLWLANFKLRVQCFKVTPFAMGDELYLNIEQIIPTPDAEDFMIGLADKAQDEIEGIQAEKQRHTIRRAFWAQLIAKMNKVSPLYQNISPSHENWISSGSGVRGVGLNFTVTQTFGRAELYIGRSERAENKFIFDALLARREEIEGAFGGELEWERLEKKKASRIKAEYPGNIFQEELWPAMIDRMTDAMVRLEAALRRPLAEVSARLRNNS